MSDLGRLPSLRRRTAEARRRIATMPQGQQLAVGEVLRLVAGDNVTDLGHALDDLGREALREGSRSPLRRRYVDQGTAEAQEHYAEQLPEPVEGDYPVVP